MHQLKWMLPVLALHLANPAIASVAGQDTAAHVGRDDNHKNVTAYFETGRRFERGLGVERNPHEAVKSYCVAARGGHSEAAFSIGWMYMTGQGLGQDHRQAAAWFRKAAGQGHATARRMLSNLPNPGRAKPACTGPELAHAEHAPPAQLVSMIRKLAPKYELDPDFVLAVVAIESGFKTDAVSPKDARGLMQLTAATADRFGVSNRFDPTDNLHGGMRFLRHLVKSYDGDLKLVLAAYNSGEGTVQRFGGLPPYAETIEYVAKVKRYYPHDRHPVGTKPDTALPRRTPPGVTVADAGNGAVVPASRQVAARP